MRIIFPHFVQSSVFFFSSSLDDDVALVADGWFRTPTLGSLSCLFLVFCRCNGDHQCGVGRRWAMTVPAGFRGLGDGKAPGTSSSSIWGDCWETLLIGTLRPPDSDGWASKWGEMGLLTSQLFCNVDPTLPSTLFFLGYDLLVEKMQIRNRWAWHPIYTALENTMGRPKCRDFDIIYRCGTAVAELWDLWLPRWRLECWGHHCHWWEEGSQAVGEMVTWPE